MFKSKKKRIDTNERAYHAISHAFEYFDAFGAFIGRDKRRILIDVKKLPESFCVDDLSELFRMSMLVGKNGALRIFRSFSVNESNGIVMFSIEGMHHKKDSPFVKFHCYKDVRKLISRVPKMSKEESAHYQSICDEDQKRMDQFISENRKELLGAIFGVESENTAVIH